MSIKYAKAIAAVSLLLTTLAACTQGNPPVQTSTDSTSQLPIPSHTTSSVASLTTTTATTPVTFTVTTPLTTLTTLPVTTPPAVVTTTPTPPSVIEPYIPADDEMVLLSEYLPEASYDIRYATTNNFTGQIIYENADAYLRYGTVKKLQRAAEMLAEEGYMLLIWDAWRPADAQWKLWEICPDGNYVSNPNNGYSSHTRGGTVDISMLASDGSIVQMPTDFDDFTLAADRNYSELPQEAADNARLLENVMKSCGFTPYQKEWWHYTDTIRYDVIEQLSERE